MYDLLKEFIKPELIVLIPVLYLIGKAIKGSHIVNWLIPYILGISGIVLCLLWVLPTIKVFCWQEVSLAIFTAITQGILIAGASVYIDQLIKQNIKRD